MEITELVWNLFLILLPGVVATLMMRYFTTHKQYPVFEFIIYAATLGISVFILMEIFVSFYWIIYSIFSDVKLKWGLNLTIWNKLFNGINSVKVDLLEIYLSYLLSIPIGFLYGFIISKKYLIRLFQKIKLTERYGDDDVWSFYFNSTLAEWIYVHNIAQKQTYYGRVRAYSDSTEKRELLLEDVIVYASDSWEQLYESNAIYLELNNYEFKIESPKIEENGES